MTVQKLDDELVLLVSEVAELERCSTDSIRRQIKLGNLRAKYVGRAVRVNREEYDRWRADYGPAS